MNRNYFQPKAGQIYLNRNGTNYFCLEEKSACSALFISMGSGWTLLAHECSLNDDGTIDWNRSDGRGFKNLKETIKEYMQNNSN
jgi:hypothetical protein